MKYSVYNIFALKYAGPIARSGAHLRWQQDWDKKAAGNYYIWCIRNPERTIVVDTGTSPAMAAQRNVTGYISTGTVLESLGISSTETGHVILSHLHWDHAGGITLFPSAKFYLHEQEYLFWIKNRISSSPPFKYLVDGESIKHLKKAEKEKRLLLIKKDGLLFPGIKLVHAPGHSPGLMAVAVNTAKGTAVIGSDSAFIRENYTEEWPHDVIFNMAEYMRSVRRLKRIASSPELLFPGHATDMADNYPEIAPGVTRLI